MGDPPVTGTLLQVRGILASWEDQPKVSPINSLQKLQTAVQHYNKEAVLLLLEHGFVPHFHGLLGIK